MDLDAADIAVGMKSFVNYQVRPGMQPVTAWMFKKYNPEEWAALRLQDWFRRRRRRRRAQEAVRSQPCARLRSIGGVVAAARRANLAGHRKISAGETRIADVVAAARRAKDDGPLSVAASASDIPPRPKGNDNSVQKAPNLINAPTRTVSSTKLLDDFTAKEAMGVLGEICIRIIAAFDLKSANLPGVATNPFAKICLGDKEFCTHTVHDTLHPFWNSKPFVFPFDIEKARSQTLHLYVYDDNADESCLGTAKLHLGALKLMPGSDNLLRRRIKFGSGRRGEVEIEVCLSADPLLTSRGNSAALKLQAFERSRQTRHHIRKVMDSREKAAVIIQAARRGSIARRQLQTFIKLSDNEGEGRTTLNRGYKRNARGLEQSVELQAMQQDAGLKLELIEAQTYCKSLESELKRYEVEAMRMTNGPLMLELYASEDLCSEAKAALGDAKALRKRLESEELDAYRHAESAKLEAEEASKNSNSDRGRIGRLGGFLQDRDRGMQRYRFEYEQLQEERCMIPMKLEEVEIKKNMAWEVKNEAMERTKYAERAVEDANSYYEQAIVEKRSALSEYDSANRELWEARQAIFNLAAPWNAKHLLVEEMEAAVEDSYNLISAEEFAENQMAFMLSLEIACCHNAVREHDRLQREILDFVDRGSTTPRDRTPRGTPLATPRDASPLNQEQIRASLTPETLAEAPRQDKSPSATTSVSTKAKAKTKPKVSGQATKPTPSLGRRSKMGTSASSSRAPSDFGTSTAASTGWETEDSDATSLGRPKRLAAKMPKSKPKGKPKGKS